MLATSKSVPLSLNAYRKLAFRSEKLAVIRQLSAGTAHDLRNPLGAIRNAAYLLKKELVNNGIFDGNAKLNNCIQIIDNRLTSPTKASLI